jgi:hypothetical protein
MVTNIGDSIKLGGNAWLAEKLLASQEGKVPEIAPGRVTNIHPIESAPQLSPCGAGRWGFSFFHEVNGPFP